MLNRDEIYEVCLVVNGPLEMSAGKLAGQTFQLAARWLIRIINKLAWNETEWWEKQEVSKWIEQGTRTIVREAKTPNIFQRVQDEIPGFLMVDEGFTEVEPNTPTVYVCGPFLHKNRPELLDNKKVRLL